MRPRNLFLLALPFSLLSLFLGLWQWERSKWKEAILHNIEMRCEAGEVLDLPPQEQWAQLNESDWSWQRVRFSGRFVSSKNPAKLWRGGKWHIVQPFKLDRREGFILIDSGVSVRLGQGIMTIEAVLMPTQRRRFFDVADDPPSLRWFVREARVIAAELQALSVLMAPVFGLVADLSLACPQPHNRHLNYALTWWSLMLLFPLIGFFGSRTKKEE